MIGLFDAFSSGNRTFAGNLRIRLCQNDYAKLVVTSTLERTDYATDSPISGDDLALIKAGKIR